MALQPGHCSGKSDEFCCGSQSAAPAVALMMPKPAWPWATTIKGHPEMCECELCMQYRVVYHHKRKLDEALQHMHRLMHDANMKLSEEEAKQKAKNDSEMAALINDMELDDARSQVERAKRTSENEGSTSSSSKRIKPSSPSGDGASDPSQGPDVSG